MISDDEIELIEQYQRGELKNGALSTFEERIVSDTNFAREVNAYSVIMAGIKRQGEHDFTNTVKGWEHELKQQAAEKPSIPIRRFWIAAACFLFFIIPASIWMYSARHVSADQHFEEYFQPYNDLVTNRSFSDSNEKELSDAMQAYNAGDYKNAVRIFNIVVDKKPENEAARFYRGVALLATDNSVVSEKDFSWFQQKDESVFFEAAQWYRVLAYLKQKRMDSVHDQLNLILIDPEHSFIEEAQALAADLRE